MVTDVAPGSPAAAPGLRPGDQILQVEGAAATAPVLNDALTARKAGDHLKLHISRNGAEQDVDAVLTGNVRRTYTLTPIPEASTAILDNWLRGVQ